MKPLVLIALPALALAAASPAPEVAQPAVLYPPAGATIAAPMVEIIAVAPKTSRPGALTIDGKPVPLARVEIDSGWQPHGIRRPGEKSIPDLLADPSSTAVWTASVRLPAGAHRIAVAGTPVREFRTVPPGTRAGPTAALLHLHPPVAGDSGGHCGACHGWSEAAGAGILGEPKTPDTCNKCHKPADLQVRHKHVMDPLSRCYTCHDPHGSPRAKLLVDDKAKLCTRCHEAGHSKG